MPPTLYITPATICLDKEDIRLVHIDNREDVVDKNVDNVDICLDNGNDHYDKDAKTICLFSLESIICFGFNPKPFLIRVFDDEERFR